MIMVETVKLELLKTEVINILRWEDDGGQMLLEVGNPIPRSKPDMAGNWQTNDECLEEHEQ